MGQGGQQVPLPRDQLQGRAPASGLRVRKNPLLLLQHYLMFWKSTEPGEVPPAACADCYQAAARHHTSSASTQVRPERSTLERSLQSPRGSNHHSQRRRATGAAPSCHHTKRSSFLLTAYLVMRGEYLPSPKPWELSTPRPATFSSRPRRQGPGPLLYS